MSSDPHEGRTMTVWFGSVTSGVTSRKRPGRTAEPPVEGRTSSHPKVTFWPGAKEKREGQSVRVQGRLDRGR
jgi:hypothetical protein